MPSIIEKLLSCFHTKPKTPLVYTNVGTEIFVTFRDKIEIWSKLNHGWDGHLALIPSQETFMAVHHFINYLEMMVISPPAHIYLNVEGEIGFSWHSAEIIFHDDGSLTGHCQVKDTKIVELDSYYSAIFITPNTEKFLNLIQKQIHKETELCH